MRELTIKYRDKSKYDLSCSEAIIYAANEFYNLNLSVNEFKMMAPFSGGMYSGETCGIVSASISVLGILFTKDNSHNSPLLKEAVLEYKERFKDIHNSDQCDYLKEEFGDPVTGCDDLIINASILLEEIVNKYGKSFK